jgi:hypothetical protein
VGNAAAVRTTPASTRPGEAGPRGRTWRGGATPRHAALPAGLLAQGQPGRAGLVAPARAGHAPPAQPLLPGHRRLGQAHARLVGGARAARDRGRHVPAAGGQGRVRHFRSSAVLFSPSVRRA